MRIACKNNMLWIQESVIRNPELVFLCSGFERVSEKKTEVRVRDKRYPAQWMSSLDTCLQDFSLRNLPDLPGRKGSAVKIKKKTGIKPETVLVFNPKIRRGSKPRLHHF